MPEWPKAAGVPGSRAAAGRAGFGAQLHLAPPASASAWSGEDRRKVRRESGVSCVTLCRWVQGPAAAGSTRPPSCCWGQCAWCPAPPGFPCTCACWLPYTAWPGPPACSSPWRSPCCRSSAGPACTSAPAPAAMVGRHCQALEARWPADQPHWCLVCTCASPHSQANEP